VRAYALLFALDDLGNPWREWVPLDACFWIHSTGVRKNKLSTRSPDVVFLCLTSGLVEIRIEDSVEHGRCAKHDDHCRNG
jgi:hypothetical protein